MNHIKIFKLRIDIDGNAVHTYTHTSYSWKSNANSRNFFFSGRDQNTRMLCVITSKNIDAILKHHTNDRAFELFNVTTPCFAIVCQSNCIPHHHAWTMIGKTSTTSIWASAQVKNINTSRL